MAYPRLQTSRNFKFHTKTAGNYAALNSVNWANVDTALDLTLIAQVGDVLEYGINAIIGNQANELYLDPVTVVSGTPVNSFGSGIAVTTTFPHYGVSGWQGQASVYRPIAGSVLYTVQAGDLSGITVTVRLRYATSTAAAHTLYAGTSSPLQVSLRNLGPAKPN